VSREEPVCVPVVLVYQMVLFPVLLFTGLLLQTKRVILKHYMEFFECCNNVFWLLRKYSVMPAKHFLFFFSKFLEILAL